MSTIDDTYEKQQSGKYSEFKDQVGGLNDVINNVKHFKSSNITTLGIYIYLGTIVVLYILFGFIFTNSFMDKAKVFMQACNNVISSIYTPTPTPTLRLIPTSTSKS